MNRYALKTKDGETIKVTEAYSIENAIMFFADMKRLNEYDILNIFDIEKIGR